MMSIIKLNNSAILNVKSANYCCVINGISKTDALNLLKNADLKMKNQKKKKNVKTILPYING